MRTTQASAAYAALRHGGAPVGRARMELGLAVQTATRLEEMFLKKTEEQRPRFARHQRHVAAVIGQGGFPVLPERTR